MAFLKQSTTYTRTFLMVDSTDHITGKTGLTVSVSLSKAGGTFAAAGGTVTEIANGMYKIALTTTDTNTLGDLAFHCTATGADASDFVDQVIAVDLADATALGLSRLDATVSSRLASASYTAPLSSAQTATAVWDEARSSHTTAGSFGQGIASVQGNVTGSVNSVATGVTVSTNNDKTGYTLSAAGIQAVWDALTANLTTVGSIGKLLSTNVDATISSRLATSAITLSGGAVTVGTNNDKTGYTIASGGIGSGAHAAAELNAIADAMLDRNMATGTDSGTDSTTVRTPRQALRSLRNKVSISGGVMTVTKEDDATSSFTAAVTTTAGNPISAVDPT